MPVLPTHLPQPFAARATRRTTIAAASALALTSCRWGPDEEPEADSTEPPDDPDIAVVEAAMVAISETLSMVVLVQDFFRGLTIALGPLARTHRLHAQLLGQTPRLQGGGLSTSREALRDVRAREQLLQRELAELALEASSGTLARALASMSASIAQLLVVFPEIGKGQA